MKKIFSYSLLVIFIFNVVGYFIVFEIEKFQIKSEIRSKIELDIDTEYLTIITFNKTDLASIEWVESEEEIRYKDDLYDVVKYTETEKTISYYCINDTEEESLFENLEAHISTHVATHHSHKNSKKNQNHIIKLYFFAEQQSILPISQVHKVLFQLDINHSSAILEKNIPPPEVV